MRQPAAPSQEKLRLALVSLDQKWEDKDYNLARCRQFAEHARACGASLIIFPEMTLTGFSMNIADIAEDAQASPTIGRFREMARSVGIAIVFGVVCREGGKAANTLVFLSSKGRSLARYVKIHPFTFAGEDKHFVPGDRLTQARIGAFTIGFTICYDLRFPEIYTALSKRCNLIVNIANWPRRRIRHWRTLLQARAIENQLYMVGVNRTGVDGNGLEYEKSSLAIDGNGDVLAPLHTGPELDVYELSAATLKDFRRQFATVQDRVPELYRSLI